MKNSTLLFYGILGIPIAFLGFPLYIYLPPFYVQHIGLNIGLVGALLLIARLIDMIADPFIGRFCDIYSSKFKIILISSLFLTLGLFFLIKPISNSYFYLFIFSIITYISYSFVLIPYLSLNAILGKNELDNTKLAFSREIFIIFGVLLSLLLPYLFLVSNDSKKSLELLLYFVLIVFPIVLILFYNKLKFLEIKNKNISHNNFFKSLKNLFKKYPNQKKLFLSFLFNNLANALPATLFLFFVKYILVLEQHTGLFLIIYFLSAIFAFPIWIKISKKISKKSTWILSIFIAISAFIFVPFLNEGDFITFSIICIVTGACLGSDMAIPSSIQADVANFIKKQEDLTSVLFGFWAMLTKLSLALALAISFITLEFTGFDKEDINQYSIVAIIFLYSTLPIIFKICAIFFLNRYEMTK
ncbi:MFS transporter [Aliarcobacter cryaerophilus ATCC 43158]|uniref:Major facilitator superfamily transporter n=1 Tax=Aliarcobacter cryaerophilus ATCC 43158 TaxID=1032070 RepID=A0AAD0X9T8_9BACT|nr:MFS transporter [Aliarcobacter cryaerophilus]AYJ79627.1 major facilitator superfamily transporter [Aliarcobacter cryaerophilus ATCC 43158]PRM95257.1 MFS transporter [Aliarcobacter cryaerophilus]QCZ23868.1 MFS transporter [Aliarcobacter cryaerophilus ATCC 43158]